MEGHLLIVSKEHAQSVLDLGESSFRAVEAIARCAFSFLEAEYGEAGIFEHGRSRLCPEPYARAQYVHAHLHAVPFSRRLGVPATNERVLTRPIERYLFQATSSSEADFRPLWGDGEPHMVRAGIVRALRLLGGSRHEDAGGYHEMLGRRRRTEQRWRHWSAVRDLDEFRYLVPPEDGVGPLNALKALRERTDNTKAPRKNVPLNFGE